MSILGGAGFIFGIFHHYYEQLNESSLLDRLQYSIYFMLTFLCIKFAMMKDILFVKNNGGLLITFSLIVQMTQSSIAISPNHF